MLLVCISVCFVFCFKGETHIYLVCLCRPSNNKENPELGDSSGSHGGAAV